MEQFLHCFHFHSAFPLNYALSYVNVGGEHVWECVRISQSISMGGVYNVAMHTCQAHSSL